ncbi:hypothetical protein B0H10DRAFT_2382136 [Mycena sp. CBHHK59/15]|nr:hypothetical protein B0H10DRAFT_2382136 [Mycena sp. CBHHK59/15]
MRAIPKLTSCPNYLSCSRVSFHNLAKITKFYINIQGVVLAHFPALVPAPTHCQLAAALSPRHTAALYILPASLIHSNRPRCPIRQPSTSICAYVPPATACATSFGRRSPFFGALYPTGLCTLSGPNTDPSELRLLIPFRKPVDFAVPTPPHPPTYSPVATSATMRFVNVLSLSPAPPSTPARPSRPPLLPYFDAARRLCAPALRRPTRSRRLHLPAVESSPSSAPYASAEHPPQPTRIASRCTTILKHSLRPVALAAFSTSLPFASESSLSTIPYYLGLSSVGRLVAVHKKTSNPERKKWVGFFVHSHQPAHRTEPKINRGKATCDPSSPSTSFGQPPVVGLDLQKLSWLRTVHHIRIFGSLSTACCDREAWMGRKMEKEKGNSLCGDWRLESYYRGLCSDFVQCNLDRWENLKCGIWRYPECAYLKCGIWRYPECA